MSTWKCHPNLVSFYYHYQFNLIHLWNSSPLTIFTDPRFHVKIVLYLASWNSKAFLGNHTCHYFCNLSEVCHIDYVLWRHLNSRFNTTLKGLIIVRYMLGIQYSQSIVTSLNFPDQSQKIFLYAKLNTWLHCQQVSWLDIFNHADMRWPPLQLT